MKTRQIASTGIQVSPLGLGTVKFGRNQGVKYPQHFALPTDKAIQALLSSAKELGINFLDTAPAYGLSEERLGRLLQGERHQWVIETKVGEQFRDNQSQFDFSAAGTRRSLEQSLRHLKTDYLDVVLIHSDGNDEAILRQTPVLETLLTMQRAGAIRAVGISSKTVSGALLAFELGCDVAMVAYNPSYTDEQAVLTAAVAQQKSILIKKAFASGHLDQIAAMNPIQAALSMAFSHKSVVSVVIGTLNPTHLRENVKIAQKVLGE